MGIPRVQRGDEEDRLNMGAGDREKGIPSLGDFPQRPQDQIVPALPAGLPQALRPASQQISGRQQAEGRALVTMQTWRALHSQLCSLGKLLALHGRRMRRKVSARFAEE